MNYWKLFLLVPDFRFSAVGANYRAECFGGLFPSEDGADGATEQVRRCVNAQSDHTPEHPSQSVTISIRRR